MKTLTRNVLATLTALLLFVGSVQATEPTQDWYHDITADYNQRVVDVRQTSDGGCVTLMQHEEEEMLYDAFDIHIVKYDASGSIDWTATYDDETYDYGYAIEETADGDYFVVGESIDDLGNQELFFLTYDNTGALVDQSDGSTLVAEVIYDVFEADPGEFYICGFTESTGSQQAYVARIDQDLTLQWETIESSGANTEYYALREFSDGGVVVVGTHWSGGADYLYAARYDDLGNTEWVDTFGSHITEGAHLDFAPDGSIYFGGTYLDGSNEDYFLVKTDEDGNEIWANTYDSGSDWDRMHDVSMFGDVVIMAGEYWNDGTEFGILAVDSTGVEEWFLEIEDIKFTSALAINPDGGFFVGGSIGGSGDEDDMFTASYLESSGVVASLEVVATSNIGYDDTGGTQHFDVTLINNYGPYTTNARIRVEYTVTGGSMVTQTWNNVTLPVGETTYSLSQNIPANLPVGGYELHVEIYNNPSNILLSDFMGFVVLYTPSAEGESGTFDGGVSGEFLPNADAAFSVDETAGTTAPNHYTLSPAYPNPFNPTTQVAVTLPEAAPLTIAVFDIQGRQVAEIVRARDFGAGTHTFTLDGRSLSSGAYFVRALVPGRMNEVQRITLVK